MYIEIQIPLKLESNDLNFEILREVNFQKHFNNHVITLMWSNLLLIKIIYVIRLCFIEFLMFISNFHLIWSK